MPQNQDQKWEYYWKDPEKIREKNRAYYYTSRGLPVPATKKKYERRDPEVRGKIPYDDHMVRIKQRHKELDEREKALDEREKRIKKIEESYTLKSYQPGYMTPSKLAQAKEREERSKKLKESRANAPVPVCAVGSASAPVSFTISKDDFW